MKACCRAWLMLIRLAGSSIRIWSNKSFSWCTFLRWSSGSRWHPIKSANRSLVGLMVLITVTFSYKHRNGSLVEQKQCTNPLSISFTKPQQQLFCRLVSYLKSSTLHPIWPHEIVMWQRKEWKKHCWGRPPTQVHT